MCDKKGTSPLSQGNVPHLLFPQQQMHMVAHQTIGMHLKSHLRFQLPHDLQHIVIIARLLKDMLVIDTAKHYMVKTCAAVLSCLPAHE